MPDPERSARRWLIGLAALAALLTVGFALGAWWLLGGPRSEVPPVLAETPDFALVTHENGLLRRDDLLDGPWVADFVFTHCPAICPRMTARMAELDATLPRKVKLVSFSVDPENDTAEVLRDYAEGVDASDRWSFLVAPDRETIRAIAMDGFLLPLDATPPPEMAASGPIVHSNRFVLVDRDGKIRGYYDAFDDVAMARLRRDLGHFLD